MKRRIASAIGAAALAASLVACGGSNEGKTDSSGVPNNPDEGVTADSIIIGWTGGITGSNASISGPHLAGLQAFAAYQNEVKGGVLGRKLVINSKDDEFNAERGVTNYAQLTGEGILTLANISGSHISSALLPLMEADDVALICPLQTVDVQLASSHAFNCVAHYADMADVMIARLGQRIGSVADVKAVAMVLEVPSGEEFATYARQKLEAQGGELTDVLTINASSPDYVTAVGALKRAIAEKGVNAVLLHGATSNGVALATEFASQNVTIPVAGITGMAAPAVYEEGAASAAEQFESVHSFLPYTADCDMCKTIRDFIAGTEWEKQAKAINFTNGWLNGMIIVQAIERAAQTGVLDRESFNKALRGAFDTGGLTCPIDWTTSNHSPCVVPFSWDASKGVLTPLGSFDEWSKTIVGEYGTTR
jgi:branched-chain amino acid transport system substrate-binding protein